MWSVLVLVFFLAIAGSVGAGLVRAVGALPTVDEFAAAIVGGALDRDVVSGKTIFVGSTEPSQL